ncbi:MAG: hypothetical protein HY996_09905 [Micrococcales bacterium]|nr:hypothetical protein [Micrococcales bacterium]
MPPGPRAPTGSREPAADGPTGLSLVRHPTDETLLATAVRPHERVGVAGLGTGRARRGRWGVPPAPHAVAGFRWDAIDDRHPRWWPQGIDVLPGEGGRPTLIAVSWYSQRGRGARVSFVDPRPDAPRYRHVTLAAPVEVPEGDSAVPGGVRLAPVEVHAGGIAIVDDRLYVAATRGGLREFRLADLLRLRNRAGRIDGPLVLPQCAHLVATTASGTERLRYSFVSLEGAGEGGGGGGREGGGGGDTADARPALVVGEYGDGPGGRLARIPLDPRQRGIRARAEVAEVHDPGIPKMQGALVRDGTWFVTASRGARAGGDLWVGGPRGFTRMPGELAPGPEDLALWPARGQLWTVAEFPGRRWVYALDAAATRARARAQG